MTLFLKCKVISVSVPWLWCIWGSFFFFHNFLINLWSSQFFNGLKWLVLTPTLGFVISILILAMHKTEYSNQQNNPKRPMITQQNQWPTTYISRFQKFSTHKKQNTKSSIFCHIAGIIMPINIFFSGKSKEEKKLSVYIC